MSAAVTELLRAWRAGDRDALESLMPVIYGELRRLASRQLRKERPDHTLRPTELVAEAYLRLAASAVPEWADRAHFFAIASRVMRQVLVDHARRRATGKRGSGERDVPFEDHLVAAGRPAELLALDDALSELAALDERKARVIEMHYFGGMSQADIATVLDVHVNTVARDLRFSEAWIHKLLVDRNPRPRSQTGPDR